MNILSTRVYTIGRVSFLPCPILRASANLRPGNRNPINGHEGKGRAVREGELFQRSKDEFRFIENRQKLITDSCVNCKDFRDN